MLGAQLWKVVAVNAKLSWSRGTMLSAGCLGERALLAWWIIASALGDFEGGDS